MTEPCITLSTEAIRNAIANESHLKRMIFDVCGTLYVENTTLALLEHIATRGGSHAWRIRAWHVVAAAGRRLGMLSPAAYMHTRIRGLQGVQRRTVEETATRLVSEHFAERAIPVELLSLAKQRGIPFGYATYTLAAIVAAVQKRFGGAVLCQSELAYDESGRCTGRYKQSLHGDRKEACIPHEWKSLLQQTGFVTDDENADESLLQAVGYPLLMPPDEPRTRAHRWHESVPGVYYYTSRYRYYFERIIHLFKFWGTYALVFLLTSAVPLEPECAALALLAWMAVYDIGCRQNDTIAASEEHGTERHGGEVAIGSLRFILIRVVWAAAVSLCLFLLNFRAGVLMMGVLLLLGGVFLLHNRLAPRNRTGTFYLLYLLKGAVLPAAAATSAPPALYMAFCVLFAMTYVPKYALSKRAATGGAAEAVRNRRSLQPIIGKNVTFIVLSLFDIRFVPVLIWVDLTTATELAFRRNAKRRGNSDNE